MDATHIRSTLEAIGAIDPSFVRVLADRTRDRKIPVMIDDRSRVIFIEDFYVGDAQYEDAIPSNGCCGPTVEDCSDTERRVRNFRHLCSGRSVLDFGCGDGTFLKRISKFARSTQGVELRNSARDELTRSGIPCFEQLTSCAPFDVAFMFHVLEHLPDPQKTLEDISETLRTTQGHLVVEVPHARDFLIAHAQSRSFLESTLWSQHLILHTRESLERLLRTSGFASVQIYGIQRYGIPNHYSWLLQGVGGGHRQALAFLEGNELQQAYENALARLDATDTLIAIASHATSPLGLY